MYRQNSFHRITYKEALHYFQHIATIYELIHFEIVHLSTVLEEWAGQSVKRVAKASGVQLTVKKATTWLSTTVKSKQTF